MELYETTFTYFTYLGRLVQALESKGINDVKFRQRHFTYLLKTTKHSCLCLEKWAVTAGRAAVWYVVALLGAGADGNGSRALPAAVQ